MKKKTKKSNKEKKGQLKLVYGLFGCCVMFYLLPRIEQVPVKVLLQKSYQQQHPNEEITVDQSGIEGVTSIPDYEQGIEQQESSFQEEEEPLLEEELYKQDIHMIRTIAQMKPDKAGSVLMEMLGEEEEVVRKILLNISIEEKSAIFNILSTDQVVKMMGLIGKQ